MTDDTPIVRHDARVTPAHRALAVERIARLPCARDLRIAALLHWAALVNQVIDAAELDVVARGIPGPIDATTPH